MPHRFFDTSALAKYYVEEIGSVWVTTLITEPNAQNYVAYVTGVEMTAALARRKLTNSLKQFEADFAHGYRRLTLPKTTVEQARDLARHYKLRGYDAIQLASALALANVLGPTNVEFICADSDLLAVAHRKHLIVGNPHDHA